MFITDGASKEALRPVRRNDDGGGDEAPNRTPPDDRTTGSEVSFFRDETEKEREHSERGETKRTTA